MTWEVVPAAPTAQGSKQTPTISIRRSAFAFNAIFIRMNSLQEAQRVTILQDIEKRRIGFQFHSDFTDANSLALVPDGGRNQTGNKGGRVVQASLVLKQPWLVALIRNRSVTKFVPYKEKGLWAIDLGPSFEVDISDPLEVPADVTGIYRYVDHGEVTYIGRGNIRQRMQEAHRHDWTFDVVQYSPMNNPEAEQRWEHLLLMEFEAKNGRLPRENRVRGFQPSTGD